MDIGSGKGYPSPHPFEFDGIQCNSMEEFFRLTKTRNRIEGE